MSKEKYNQIMMEAYRQYSEKSARKLFKSNTYQEFIDKCKTDSEFSKTWGLKIEERELSLIERTKILVSRSDHKKDFYDRNGRLIVEEHTLVLDESNIPTKLITLTYNNETIESYE